MELPPPWELKESTRYPGRCYYYNPETQESSWLRPRAYPGETKWNFIPPIIYVLHILVKYDEIDHTVQRKKKEALEEIKSIQRDLINGKKKFEDMAREKSENRETGEKGGEIGWIKRDDMSIEFAQMAWKLRPGEMSPPIETKEGYQLILRRG
ncbi:positive regulation of chromatin silencing at rDNA [Tritrichomonas musculus]|uniref:Peptidyl-prolyl cis-trans isomerase n=1 Tax=Tritrichomonas musculus TaxID=1915356 RepID=A0ABR2KT21_9EUKA